MSYTSATPFPGVTALPPVVDTALLIWSGAAGTPTIVARALSLPPIVWIGAISYSLYLWHWPILAYLRIATGFTILDRPVALAAIAVSVALAYATLRLVEQPLRYGRAPAMPRSVATGAAATGLVAFGLFVWAVDGVPMRLSPAAARIAAATEDRTELPIECWDFGPVALSDECRIGADAAQDGRIDFVFWGDSHALAIKPAIDELARASGRSGLFAGRGACPPMDGVVRLNEYVNRTCAAFQNVVLEALDRRDDIDTVILHARWARMAEGRGAGYYRGSFLLLGDEVTHSRQPQENFNIFARGLERTVQRIAATGRRVVVIGATPEVGWHVPNVLFSAERLQLAPPDPLMAEDVRQRNSRVTALMTALNDEGLIHAIFDVTPRFCDPTCALTVEGRPTFFDGHHLTRSAALELLAGHPELGPLPLFERVPDRN